MSNLPLLAHLDRLEQRGGVPILHVNAVLFWHALRQLGISDRIPGYGRLLSA